MSVLQAARPASGMRRLACLGGAQVLLVALEWAVLAGDWPALPAKRRTAVFVALVCVGGMVWGASVAIVRRCRLPRRALWLVLGCAALMRAVTFAAPPLLSSDIYRYVWNGKVEAAGINPYRYVPAAPELRFLRDGRIYPHINRATYARTIYPPFAQTLFFLIARLSPTVRAMKAAMLGFDVLAIVCLIRLLGIMGRPAAEVAIYAWLPLPAWAFVGDGHVDAVAAGLVALAVLCGARQRSTLAGMVLGAATLVKFLPASVLPAFWRRWDWRLAGAFVAIVVALYLPYLGAGWHVLGFLPGYVHEEGLATGHGVFLLDLIGRVLPLPAWAGAAYLAFVLCVLAALAARFAFGAMLADKPAHCVALIAQQAATLGTVTMVALSPHYPWYLGWLAPLACLAPYPALLWLLGAAALLALDPVHNLVFPTMVYGPAAVLSVRAMWRRRAGALLEQPTVGGVR